MPQGRGKGGSERLCKEKGGFLYYMEGNLLVVHGGGPTAVLNASLYGVIREAQKNPEINKIYGAIGGSEAVIEENFLDMGELSDEKIELLLQTPGTAIGSSRFPLEQEQYEAD